MYLLPLGALRMYIFMYLLHFKESSTFVNVDNIMNLSGKYCAIDEHVWVTVFSAFLSGAYNLITVRLECVLMYLATFYQFHYLLVSILYVTLLPFIIFANLERCSNAVRNKNYSHAYQ